MENRVIPDQIFFVVEWCSKAVRDSNDNFMLEACEYTTLRFNCLTKARMYAFVKWMRAPSGMNDSVLIYRIRGVDSCGLGIVTSFWIEGVVKKFSSPRNRRKPSRRV